jgi:predicted DNA-binding transcriptional regulator YafY
MPPRYVERLGRVAQALQLLVHHPDGLTLEHLAAELGTTPRELRAEILAYYSADIGPDRLHGLLRSPVLEFLGPDGSERDPAEAERVRLVDERPTDELGIAYVSAAELARVYESGQQLLSLEPGNTVLRGALLALESTALQGLETGTGAEQDDVAGRLRSAIDARRLVRISYARAWHPGVAERVVEPYRLLSTRRGWELDAGPLDASGRPRSYLLSGIRAAQALDESYDPPADLDEALEANRQEVAVEIVLPQEARWVAARFAERLDVVEEDESSVKIRAHVLPPVAERIGLVLVVAGPDAFVMSPAAYQPAGAELAARLLAHHSGGPAVN